MATAAVQIQRFHRDRSAMFDLGLTAELHALFNQPRPERDATWLDLFYDIAWFAALEEAGIAEGPDGLPYLRLNLPRPGERFETHCLANRAGDCLAAGCGAAIFSSADDPPEAAQFVFSLGVLDSMIRYDSPDGDPIDIAESVFPRERLPAGAGGSGSARQRSRRARCCLQRRPTSSFRPMRPRPSTLS